MLALTVLYVVFENDVKRAALPTEADLPLEIAVTVILVLYAIEMSEWSSLYQISSEPDLNCPACYGTEASRGQMVSRPATADEPLCWTMRTSPLSHCHVAACNAHA